MLLMLNKCIEVDTTQIYNKKLGLQLLDQTQPAISKMSNKDEYNPSIEVIRKELDKISKNYSQVCGFTLTFKKKYHSSCDKWLHRKVHNEIKKSKIWKDTKYIIFCEYTKKGILHYHGIIYDSYEIQVMRCIKWWRRLYGFAKPELKLINKQNWLTYITKDYGKTGLWTMSKIN